MGYSKLQHINFPTAINLNSLVGISIIKNCIYINKGFFFSSYKSQVFYNELLQSFSSLQLRAHEQPAIWTLGWAMKGKEHY